MADAGTSNVESISSKLDLIIHRVEHLGQRHQLGACKLVRDERVEIIAVVLAVHDDIHPSLDLKADTAADLIVGDALKLDSG